MDITKLEYFLSVCEHLNFTKAAEDLYVTAQGLNLAISRMERELNVKLFVRTSKGLLLTDSGYLLRETAQTILGVYNRYQQKVQNKDVINIACMPHVFAALPRTVQRLLFNLDPEFEVALDEKLCSDCEEKLLRGEVDFAIAVPLASMAELNACRLYPARIVAVVNKYSDWAREETITVDMLEDVRFLTTSSSSKTQQILMEQLKLRSISPRMTCGFKNPASIIEIVDKHPEITGILMDYFLIGTKAPNLLVKHFKEPCMGFDISLVKNVSRVQSKNAYLFETHLFSLMHDAQRTNTA